MGLARLLDVAGCYYVTKSPAQYVSLCNWLAVDSHHVCRFSIIIIINFSPNDSCTQAAGQPTPSSSVHYLMGGLLTLTQELIMLCFVLLGRFLWPAKKKASKQTI